MQGFEFLQQKLGTLILKCWGQTFENFQVRLGTSIQKCGDKNSWIFLNQRERRKQNCKISWDKLMK